MVLEIGKMRLEEKIEKSFKIFGSGLLDNDKLILMINQKQTITPVLTPMAMLVTMMEETLNHDKRPRHDNKTHTYGYPPEPNPI